MEILIFIILGAYLLTHFIMLAGILNNSKKPVNAAYEPKVSIIICAKDEEESIEDCIISLLNLDYPKEKLEVILVNDRSVDKTKEIMTGYVSKNPSLKYFEVTETHAKLKGKANALAQALKSAAGDVIFTTDADIEVNTKWVKEILKYYDENTGVVAGYSVIKPIGFFSTLQSADWLYLLSVASGGDGIGIPISCVGNNMSYLRKAYNEIGGYETIPFSVTEDFMLLQKIHKDGGYKTRFPVNNNTKNITLPCLTLTQLIRQKKRWAAGGIGEFNMGILIGALGWLTAIVMLAGWAFIDLRSYVLFFAAKLIADALFLLPAIKEFKMYKIFLYMPFFEVYYALYVLLTSVLLAVDRKVVWKDQKI